MKGGDDMLSITNDWLQERIGALFEELGTLEPGSKEAEKITQQIETLYDIHNDEFQHVTNLDLKQKELDLKQKEEKHKWISYGISIFSVVTPLICYGVWYNRGMKFEENGVYTSTWLKNLMSKMKPSK